jgi:2-polyprenyl-3-methyl-5-hydroxy-6-metoxy-1,4-benzoquinol methylase
MWPEVTCPEDGQPLARANEALVCPAGHRWPDRLGIPRMVRRTDSYADAFGLQWKVYRKVQLDSYTKTTLSLDRARRCLGEACWERLQESERSDVLEVGCGAGRFTEVLLSTRAHVTSVDLSTAVEANQENFPQNGRHRVLQADVYRLPFAPGQYDVVLCLGVVQHTPDPEKTIASLYAQVKPGGWLVIDHYTHALSHYTKTAPLVRSVLRRMSPQQGLKWTERLVTVFFPLHRAARKSHVAQALLSRVSPVLSYYHAFPLDDDLQRQWAFLDTHDSLTDWYKHFRTVGQIRRALEGLRAEEIWCARGGNGVEARCRRPSRG